MMNILMQLRKVCNHPDLFEPRPISSPFVPIAITYSTAALVTRVLESSPLNRLSSFMTQFWPYDIIDHINQKELISLTISKHAFIDIEDVSLIDTTRNIPKTSKFQTYVNNLKEILVTQIASRNEFNYNLMYQRNNDPRLSYDWRLIKALKISFFPIQVIESLYNNRIARYITHTWYELIKSINDRAYELRSVIEQFVFVLPKVITHGIQLISAGLNNTLKHDSIVYGKDWVEVKKILSRSLLPFYPAFIRQRIFFPDRKLIQFDSGKLQMLAVLLRNLKKDGHKCLIFTQMSKMLDILEIFLNLHDHTFVRLDGSTSIDRRQKLMDRFNSDSKLFCFILSTRSGGLGINLTGADTVIFYDTDWNPAMDAQAQDRAHRIGQTREVHIYRLVSESTVEENILTKAKQKRHLDFLVMTEGNFSETSLFSSKGLKDMLGVTTTGIISL